MLVLGFCDIVLKIFREIVQLAIMNLGLLVALESCVFWPVVLLAVIPTCPRRAMTFVVD